MIHTIVIRDDLKYIITICKLKGVRGREREREKIFDGLAA